jgi:peroxiredoxin Q/BCP
MLAVGEMAPDFDLSSDKGERIQLSQLRGSRVLLWFFPKADTPG